MKKAILICVCLLGVLALAAAGACAVIWHMNTFSLELTVAGEPEITLEYGSEYTAPDASAMFFGTLLNREQTDVEVVIDGTVDTSRVGDYILTYRAAHRADYKLVQQELTQVETRIVHIVDTQAPTITLHTDPDHFTFPNQPYSEEGFTASDDYDGDLTEAVQCVEENGTVTYRVSDSSGNTFEITRTVVYDDPVPPTLVLTAGEFEGKYWEKYAEPGYTATDNCDGDITGSVVVEDDLNGKLRKYYTLTYTVSDSHGNTATAQRLVNTEPNFPDIILEYPNPALPANGKVIYLTFDDGPSIYTTRLLEILAKYNIKATFFVVSNKYSDIITQIAQEGHTVAMHTATHNFERVYSSVEAYYTDLYAIQSLIEQKTGVAPMLLRFPGGSSNKVSSFNPGIMSRLTASVEDKGFSYFDWNVDSNDAGGATCTAEVLYNIVSGILKHGDSVVLQHDTASFSVDAVETIIQWGLANGYTFLPLTESSPQCHHRIRN